jgi:hypothetical protein
MIGLLKNELSNFFIFPNFFAICRDNSANGVLGREGG